MWSFCWIYRRGGGCTPQTVFIPGRHSRVWRFAQVSSSFRLEIFGQKEVQTWDLTWWRFFSSLSPKAFMSTVNSSPSPFLGRHFCQFFADVFSAQFSMPFSMARHFHCHHHQVCGFSFSQWWCGRHWSSSSGWWGIIYWNNLTIYLYSGQDGRDHCSVDEV